MLVCRRAVETITETLPGAVRDFLVLLRGMGVVETSGSREREFFNFGLEIFNFLPENVDLLQKFQYADFPKPM